MRILHVSSLWQPVVLGGAELYAANLAAEQRAAGHTVGVITFGVPGEEVVEVVPAWPFRLDQFRDQPRWKMAIFRLQDVYNPRAVAHMRAAIRRFSPDIVHSHSVVGLSTAALTAQAKRVPHVHHVHDYWLMCRHTTMRLPSGEPCQDLSCRALTVARSQVVRRHPPELLFTASQQSILDHNALGWPAGRLRHLPYSIGVEFEGHKDAFESARPVTFGYIGQVSKQKGVDTLLQAFAGLAPMGHRLLVAGEGELSEEVQRGDPGVVALGWITGTDKDRFFSDVDCLIVPSKWPETGPMVVQESRAYGVPVIGARIGGIPENVGDRCESLLFPPGDGQALQVSMERFAADPRRYQPPLGGPPARIGRNWPDHTRDVMDLYQEAIERRRAPAPSR
jgi:glycosyltransferase involved in cell wall biosynthesis